MSADLLDLEDDADGNGIELTMNVNGYAYLCVDDGCEFPCYELTPDSAGFDKARKIIQALEAWMAQAQAVTSAQLKTT